MVLQCGTPGANYLFEISTDMPRCRTHCHAHCELCGGLTSMWRACLYHKPTRRVSFVHGRNQARAASTSHFYKGPLYPFIKLSRCLFWTLVRDLYVTDTNERVSAYQLLILSMLDGQVMRQLHL